MYCNKSIYIYLNDDNNYIYIYFNIYIPGFSVQFGMCDYRFYDIMALQLYFEAMQFQLCNAM